MFSLCLLCLTFVPQVDGKLVISNIRATLVDLGPTRPDTNYLPGDVVHVTFDAAGFKLDEEGRYRFSAKLQVEDGAGKLMGSEDYGSSPSRLGVIGNGKSRFAFRLPIPVEQAAGNYKAKLVLSDVNSKAIVTVEQSYRVMAPGFGLIRLQTGRGPFGQSETPCTGNVGEVLHLGMQAVGLGKLKDNLGSLDITLEVKDAMGKSLGKPQVNNFPDINVNEPLQLRFELPLDQAGKYQVVFKGVDKASSKSTTLTVPLQVVE